MTDAPKKTIALAPAHWRQLALLNVAQLHNFIDGIPAQTESGISALTDEQIAVIDAHLDEHRSFLRAWRLSRMPQMAAQQPAPAPQQANGKHEPEPVRRKGGWPKGKPRKPKQPAVQQ